MVKKRRRKPKPKKCSFCQHGIQYVDYKDLNSLKPYLTERARIKARRSTGTCAQHQVQLAAAIKTAREMALLPYAAR